jgi:chitinase
MDGLDIDWEYPANAQEAQDYVDLLKTCRAAMDSYAAKYAKGHHFLLTIAAPAGPKNYDVLDIEAMDPLLDAWHIMAYDYAGSWDSTSGHQANLFHSESNPEATKFSTERAVRDYIARGVPSRKIVLGLPLYGRQFENTEGPGKPYNGIGSEGSLQGQPGIWLYRDLPRPGAEEFYDEEAGAAYSFQNGTGSGWTGWNKNTNSKGRINKYGEGTMVSYDTLTSARRKVEYLLENKLGGAVFWEAAGDKKGDESLVAAVRQGMGKLEQTKNWLSYPDSQYENIRAGMPGS